MKFKYFWLVAGLAYGMSAGAESLVVEEGSAEAGKEKSTVCTACHGADGNSSNPEWPKLAGQHAQYLVSSLKAYKNGDRNNAIMMGQASQLSEQDIKNLAAFYAQQELKPGVANPDLVERGRKIYQGGIAEEGVPACLACHGPDGAGNPASHYPAIGGQHATYLITSLKAYADGDREGYGNMMPAIAQGLNDDDMKAVASYIEGLHKAEP